MASKSDWEHRKVDSSAIVEMEVISGDESDYETNFSSEGTDAHKRTSQPQQGDFMSQVKQGVTSYVFESGRQQAKRAYSLYGNIDILRPYFNVELHEIRERLIFSLVPRRPGAQKQRIPRELYGPLMVILTLIALLLFQMKSMGHTVEEGTLMGTAFGVCFGYWLGTSSLIWFLSYVCNTNIAAVQVLSLIGYALFGHCIVVFLGTVLHSGHDHVMFYILWAVLGGLSTMKMVAVLSSRTTGQTQKVIICATITVLHLLFLLYLHFAYHQIVEDISRIVEKPVIPQPVGKETQQVDRVLGAIGDKAAGITKIARELPGKANIDSVKRATVKALRPVGQHIVEKVLASPTIKSLVKQAVTDKH